MAKRIDLRRPGYKARARQVQTYGTQTPLSSTAVERGTTRWLDGSVVSVDGILRVAGTLGVTGTLNGEGINNLSGVNNLSGANHLTGPTDVAGNLELIEGGLFKAGESVINPDGSASFGGLTIGADGTLTTGDTVIDTTGRAEFGSFVIDPASNKLIQAPGGWLFSDGIDQMALSSSSTSSVNLNGSYAELNYSGSSVVRAEAGVINLNSPAVNLNAATVTIGTSVNKLASTSTYARVGSSTRYFQASDALGLRVAGLLSTALPPNLYVDANGWLYKSTWTP